MKFCLIHVCPGIYTSVSVRRADTGELLDSHQGNVRLHPASNMKILTAVAALETLGPEYRFSTEVWTDGSQDGNVLNGNVYLKGQGDPTLMKEDLDRFAAELKAQGITHITGHLVGDDSSYDDVRLSLRLKLVGQALLHRCANLRFDVVAEYGFRCGNRHRRGESIRSR